MHKYKKQTLSEKMAVKITRIEKDGKKDSVTDFGMIKAVEEHKRQNVVL